MSAIKLSGKCTNVQIENNILRDTWITYILQSFIYNEAANMDGCSYTKGNRVEMTDGNTLLLSRAENKYQGKPWE